MTTPPTAPSADVAPTSPIKHWRSFGPSEWQHVREGVLGLMLGSVLPVVIWYGTLRLRDFTTAVIVVLVWSGLVFFWHRQRTGGVDVFSGTTFVFACTKAAAGLVSQNQQLYLGFPSFENLIYGVAFLGSALLGKPILALYAERLYPIPDSVRATDTFKHAFIVTSAAWFVGQAVRGVVRLFLLFNLPLEIYLVADTVAGWPINISLIAFTTWYPLRQLRKAGFMNVQPVERSAMDTIELVLEEAEPTTV